MGIMNLFKQFKLGNSVFTYEYSMGRDFYHGLPEIELDNIAERKITQELANFIISKHNSSISKTSEGMAVKYKCSLMVLKVDDFKTIVEAAIKMMPMPAIEKIRTEQ